MFLQFPSLKLLPILNIHPSSYPPSSPSFSTSPSFTASRPSQVPLPFFSLHISFLLFFLAPSSLSISPPLYTWSPFLVPFPTLIFSVPPSLFFYASSSFYTSPFFLFKPIQPSHLFSSTHLLQLLHIPVLSSPESSFLFTSPSFFKSSPFLVSLPSLSDFVLHPSHYLHLRPIFYTFSSSSSALFPFCSNLHVRPRPTPLESLYLHLCKPIQGERVYG